MGKYGKSIVMVLIVVLVGIRSALLGDQHVSSGELVQIIFSGVAAFNVWLVPNFERFPWVKHAVIALMAISDLAITMATNMHVTGDEWINLLIVFLGSAFALAAPSQVHPTQKVVTQELPPDNSGIVPPPDIPKSTEYLPKRSRYDSDY